MIQSSSYLVDGVKLHGVLSGEKWVLLGQVLRECGQTASRSEHAHIHASTPGFLDISALGLA